MEAGGEARRMSRRRAGPWPSRADPVACLLCSGNGSPFSSCPVPALLSLLGSEAERIWNQDAEEQIASSNFITEYVITRL